MKLIMSWCPGQGCDPCKPKNLQLSGSPDINPALNFSPNPWTGPADYAATATITVKDYLGVVATPNIIVTGTTFLRFATPLKIIVPFPLTGLNCPDNFDFTSHVHVFMHVAGTNSPYYAGGLQVFINGNLDPYFQLTII